MLDHLAEMSGNLRQWDMEKDLQNSLAAEVKKLRDQLKMAEKRLQEQRDRVNSMGLKVLSARQKINNGRQEFSKLSKMCLALGNRLLGKSYRCAKAIKRSVQYICHVIVSLLSLLSFHLLCVFIDYRRREISC